MSNHQQCLARLRVNIARYESRAMDEKEVVAFFVELWNARYIERLPPLYRDEFDYLLKTGRIVLSKRSQASIGYRGESS